MCEIFGTQLLNFVYSTVKFPLGYGYVLPFFCTQHSCALSWLSTNDLRYLFFSLPGFVSLPINFAFPCSSLDLASFIFLPNGKYGYFWFIEYSQFYLQSICRGVFFFTIPFPCFCRFLYVNDLFKLSFYFNFSSNVVTAIFITKQPSPHSWRNLKSSVFFQECESDSCRK